MGWMSIVLLIEDDPIVEEQCDRTFGQGFWIVCESSDYFGDVGN